MDGKPNRYVFVFTPSIGVEHFWVGLYGRHVFAPTPSVGVVVTPNFKDKIECTKLMCVQRSITHIS